MLLDPSFLSNLDCRQPQFLSNWEGGVRGGLVAPEMPPARQEHVPTISLEHSTL